LTEPYLESVRTFWQAKERQVSVYRWLFPVLTLLWLGLAACQNENQSGSPAPEITYAHLDGRISLGGTSLLYALSLPRTYAPGRPTPLTLALHYGGDVTPFTGRHFLDSYVEPALGQLGSILVAPLCPAPGCWTDSTSMTLVMALVDSLRAEYEIHPDRILVTGFSLGAIGTWHLAQTYPHFFCAAIPVAGLPEGEVSVQLGDLPVQILHGEFDFVFPLVQVEELARRLQDRGHQVVLTVVPNALHHEVSRYIDPLAGTIPWIRASWQN